MITDLLLLTLIIVFIIDISGVITNIKKRIWKWLKGDKPYYDFPFKPFDCSLCMTFWSGLIYLLVVQSFTIPMIAFVCLLSWSTIYIKDFLYLLGDAIQALIDRLSKALQ